MGEPAAPGTPSLAAIQARLDQQIPHLYRDLALYLQVLREVLPAGVDQACSHLATQVHPLRYNSLPPQAREQLHERLKRLLASCCSLLTVEQLHSLAGQMQRERQRGADTEQDRFLPRDVDLDGDSVAEPLPAGSIRLSLHPPLSLADFALPGREPGLEEESTPARETFFPEVPTRVPGQLPRDPVALIHSLDGWNAALSRRLRILSHSVNLELMRVGLMAGVLPVTLLDAVLAGQVETQAAPANLLRLPFLSAHPGGGGHPSMGLLLRTVDLEMEQPRLRTCRRRLLHHRQEILKMAETSLRLQRRLQTHHAQRLWRHDSQLNRPEAT